MTENLAEVHPELFHYTNAKGLIGIIENQSIWATHYAYLNDSEEIRHFLKHRLPALLRTVGDEYLDELITQDQKTQLLVNRQGGRKKVVDSFIQETRNVNEKILLKDALAEPYIASFCTASRLEKDVRDQVAQHGLLSQWRWYGHEGGYAIVFETEQFWELLKDFGKKMTNSMYLFLADVIYSSDPDSKFIEEFEEDLNVIKEFFYNHLRNIEDDKNVSKIFYSLMHCACRYKHWGFREENEVRLVILPHNTENKDFLEAMRVDGEKVDKIPKNFFPRAGILVPYIDLFKDVTSKPNKPLPIKRIIIGPSVNEEERNRRVNAVKMLIGQHNINAEVIASDIPFVGAAQ